MPAPLAAPTPYRRLLGAVTAALVVLAALVAPVALAGPAAAEPDYPPQFNQISASRYAVFAGQRVVFRAQTFTAGSSVAWTATLDGGTVASGTTTANPRGRVVQGVRFTRVGVTTVSFSGTSWKGKPLTLSASVTVRAKPGSSAGTGSSGASGGGATASGGTTAAAGGLPVTGTQVALTLGLGLVLVLVGATLVLVGRRRRA